MKHLTELQKQALRDEANRIIDAMGGSSAVANIFNLTVGAVSQWRTDGIPETRMFSIRLLRKDLFKGENRKAA